MWVFRLEIYAWKLCSNTVNACKSEPEQLRRVLLSIMLVILLHLNMWIRWCNVVIISGCCSKEYLWFYVTCHRLETITIKLKASIFTLVRACRFEQNDGPQNDGPQTAWQVLTFVNTQFNSRGRSRSSGVMHVIAGTGFYIISNVKHILPIWRSWLNNLW